MLLTERSSIQKVEDIEKLVYHTVKEERQWRVEVVELLLLAREEEGLEDFDQELLEWLCTD